MSDFSMSISLPDPDQAIEELDKAMFAVRCLLDYCAVHHRERLRNEYGDEFEELRDHFVDDLQNLWLKHMS